MFHFGAFPPPLSNTVYTFSHSHTDRDDSYLLLLLEYLPICFWEHLGYCPDRQEQPLMLLLFCSYFSLFLLLMSGLGRCYSIGRACHLLLFSHGPTRFGVQFCFNGTGNHHVVISPIPSHDKDSYGDPVLPRYKNQT